MGTSELHREKTKSNEIPGRRGKCFVLVPNAPRYVQTIKDYE